MKAVTCFVVFVVFQSAMVKSAEIKRAMPKKSAVKDAVAKNVAVSAATNEVKKCPKVLNKIPVDPKFNINEFAGEWFTVTRTTWAYGDNTYGSMTIEIFKQSDGVWKFRYSGSSENKCLPVTESTLKETRRPGHFIIMAGNTIQATFIVSFTDYKDLAIVIYCHKHSRGKPAQCENDGFQIDIMSRTLKPKKKLISDYVKRALKRLCGKEEDFIDTKPGVCKIPNILEQAKLDKTKLDKEVSQTESSDKCAVENIPVQKDFDLTQMEGIWYEIARTRFTFNKLESVVASHRLGDDKQTIKSYYTGTIVNSNTEGEASIQCMTAIKGMSKSREGATDSADRVGRIGWEDSEHQWSPTRVIYADGEYTMFYACYSGETNQKCTEQAMEVTLAGKSREISQEKKDAIYSILPSVCVSPADMKDTKFLADCTSWVDIKEENDLNRCLLDNIKVFAEYDSDQMKGRWYLYGSISYNNRTSLQGVVMHKHAEGMNEVIHTEITAYDMDVQADAEADMQADGLPSRKCASYSTQSRDTCINIAEFVTTVPVGGVNGFVFTKVLYIDEFKLVEYVCNYRDHDGRCKKEGVSFNVYTKNDTKEGVMDVDTTFTALINDLAKSACLNPEDFQMEYEWCDATDATVQNKSVNDNPQCDVDQLSIVSDMDDYTPEMIVGYWHEHARTIGGTLFTTVTSTVAYISSASNDTLQIYTTGFRTDSGDATTDKACAEVTHTSLISRCRSASSGDYLTRFLETEDYATYIPFKILYSDYVNVLVTYGCEHILPGGLCANGAAHVRIWSRDASLNDEARDFAYEMIFWACQDPQNGLTVFNHQETGNCMSALKAYVTEHELAHVPAKDKVADTNQQQDGADEQDAIDAAFNVPDDVFYGDVQQ